MTATRRRTDSPSGPRRVLLALALLLGSGTAFAATTAVERGAYLAAAAGCITCHTDRDNNGADYAGGHRLETPFGTFVTPNITPDPDTGIGGWSLEEFADALRKGRGPGGMPYYPAFPYASYAGISDADVADLKAYFDSVPAVNRRTAPNELAWYLPGRWAMAIWQWLWSPWDYPPAAGDDTELARGAYLVRHLGHCGECHTPRNRVGVLETARELAGVEKTAAVSGVPPIDAAGLANWSLDDLELFLDFGMTPEGDFAGSGMGAVIKDNTSRLTPADRRAIARFLLSR